MTLPGAASLARAATELWGSQAVRAADNGDDGEGPVPAVLLEPADVSTLADMLRWASTERLSLVPRGAGTKLDWSARGPGVDAGPSAGSSAGVCFLLSTARLNAPIEHWSGDLTATAPAGASLAAVNALLGRNGQWLPVDPPFADRATIGGIVATNDSGPRRHKHGTPRDLIIGIEMALADGRTAKAGGRVVKNVAGYDLARLLCGSFGSLAVITKATFKLAPLPPSSRTIVATAGTARQLAELALAVAAAPLTPSAIDLTSPPRRVLIRFETTRDAAQQQTEAARQLCISLGAEASIVEGRAEAELWQAYEARLWRPEGTLVKVSVLPTLVADVLERVDSLAAAHSLACQAGGRAALGVLFLRFSGGAEQHPAAIDRLRRDVCGQGGSVVVRFVDPGVKSRVDIWGSIGDGLPLMRAVKARFDPNGILNPGRGPGGI